MQRIGLLSDTHSYIDENILSYFKDCDEIWHAGDVGKIQVVDRIKDFKPLRAVYGNIDGKEVRAEFPLDLRFIVEGMDVLITHIGGYPGRYNRRVIKIFQENPPDLFICGHSHILKVMYDKRYDFLHMNPGSCGHSGFHKMRTMLRFTIDKGRIEGLQAIELGARGRFNQTFEEE